MKLHPLHDPKAHYVIVEKDWPNLACLVNLISVLWFQLDVLHSCPLHDHYYMYLGLLEELLHDTNELVGLIATSLAFFAYSTFETQLINFQLINDVLNWN